MNRSREPVSPTSFASRTPRLTLGISASSKNTVLIFLCFQGWVACKDEDAGHRRAMMINRVRYLLFRICFNFVYFFDFLHFLHFVHICFFLIFLYFFSSSLSLSLALSLSRSLSLSSCVRCFAVPIVVLLSLHTSTLKLALPKSVMRLQSRFGPKESVKSGWSLNMEIDTTIRSEYARLCTFSIPGHAGIF